MKYRIGSSAVLVALATSYCMNVDNFSLYIAYTCLIALLVQAAANTRVSVFLQFLIGMFVLGNWLKVTLHGIFQYPYVEATGSFSGSAEHWDSFFLVSIKITAALLLSVVANIHAPRSPQMKSLSASSLPNSKLFIQASVLFILSTYALNWEFGFYRIGVARELDLPFGLNAPASFMVFMIAPMLAAILATNSVHRRKRVTTLALIGIAFVAIIAAITTYSRATIVVVMLPIIMGAYKKSHELNGRPQSKINLIIVLVPTVIVLLVAVSMLRILTYGGAQVVTRTDLEFYFYQSLGLFVDRWVGAEGIMVSVSSSQSLDLFYRALFESPTAGVNSIYQNIAGSQYLSMYLINMTFLTLPGAFSILSFSGSSVVIFLGVVTIALTGIVIEEIIKRYFRGQHAIVFLVSGNLAYHFSQMIFPRLFIPFIVQILVFATILSLIFAMSDKSRFRTSQKLY